MRVGADDHLTLLCRTFIDTHQPFDPAALPWPDLVPSDVEKLRALPFWDEAIRTERRTGAKVRAYAETERPALLREAVALQGYEETRHAQLLETLVRRYGIAANPGPETVLPPKLEAAFMRTGYGECIDSFFAFGLFDVAREVEFLPRPLLDVLAPIVQEEARHILFHVNWVAYKRAQRPPLLQPLHRARCVAAFAGAAYDRARSGLQLVRGSNGAGVEDGGADRSGDGFTAAGARSIAPAFSVRRFIARCLDANGRRFAPYDPRLLRPRVVPALARTFLAATRFRAERETRPVRAR